MAKFSQSVPAHRVVVVEPHDDSRDVYALYFAWSGIDVIAVPTAAEALSVIAHGTPDAIVMCLRLPDMDASALCDAVRAMPTARELPILALSSSLPDHQRAMADARFTAVVMKPCLPETLVRAILALSDRDRAQTSGSPARLPHGRVPDGISLTCRFRVP